MQEILLMQLICASIIFQNKYSWRVIIFSMIKLDLVVSRQQCYYVIFDLKSFFSHYMERFSQL